MYAVALQMRGLLAAQWKWFAQYLGAPKILSLAFFDPSFVMSSDRRTVLAAAVDAAVALTSADLGNVQLREPRRCVLRIEAATRIFTEVSGVLRGCARRRSGVRPGGAERHAHYR
jgi:hypothetical protein